MMELHIRSLDEEKLAYREQQEKSWPGLAMETKQICEDLGIADCNTTVISKQKYRKLVTDAWHERNINVIVFSNRGRMCSYENRGL